MTRCVPSTNNLRINRGRFKTLPHDLTPLLLLICCRDRKLVTQNCGHETKYQIVTCNLRTVSVKLTTHEHTRPTELETCLGCGESTSKQAHKNITRVGVLM